MINAKYIVEIVNATTFQKRKLGVRKGLLKEHTRSLPGIPISGAGKEFKVHECHQQRLGDKTMPSLVGRPGNEPLSQTRLRSIAGIVNPGLGQ